MASKLPRILVSYLVHVRSLLKNIICLLEMIYFGMGIHTAEYYITRKKPKSGIFIL